MQFSEKKRKLRPLRYLVDHRGRRKLLVRVGERELREAAAERIDRH